MYFSKPNVILEDKINRYFGLIGEAVDSKFPGDISIMLLGSMSRDEATWEGEGEEAYLLSDIEFFTVYGSAFDSFSEFDRILKDAKNEVFGAEKSSLFHIDNTYVSKDKMLLLERKLLTFDAQVYGRCVVGEDVKHLLPHVTVDNINLRDIKDIMTHRVFSTVYYGFPLKNTGRVSEYRYCLAKNSLDLMIVLLIQRGQLVSGFGNRLEKLLNTDIPAEQKEFFKYCLSVKYNSAVEELYTIPEMEDMLFGISWSLYKSFKIPMKNIFVNRKVLARRFGGIVKRAIKTGHFVKLPYFPTVYKYAKNGRSADVRLCKDNYVINGYPTVK